MRERVLFLMEMVLCPHPMQTVGATQELFDELFVSQAGDVSGAYCDLGLTANSQGLVCGRVGLLSHRRRVLLKERDRNL